MGTRPAACETLRPVAQGAAITSRWHNCHCEHVCRACRGSGATLSLGLSKGSKLPRSDPIPVYIFLSEWGVKISHVLGVGS